MSYPGSIFIFDIDGVLVEPHGYRAATLATLCHFIERMGLDAELAPDLESIEWFEAMHITSEWDMVPISLAILLETLAKENPQLRLPIRMDDLSQLHLDHRVRRIDYRAPLEYLSTCLQPQEYPATTALLLSGDHLSAGGKRHPGLFPHLSGSPLIVDILSHSRDPYRSSTTRVFQHFSLGSRVFEQVYDAPAILETDSLLAACDEPQLSRQVQQALGKLVAAGRLAVAVLTNRPSYPPREVSETVLGYPPEAEMALELNGLSGIPLISFGRIRYLAERRGLEPETLLKPSPVSAAATILAALTGRELPALEAALDLMGDPGIPRRNQVRALHNLGLDSGQIPTGGIMIHVFEDTRWGIEATQAAGVALSQMGLANTVFAWGIARGEMKAHNLRRTGASVYDDTSSAVQAAVELI